MKIFVRIIQVLVGLLFILSGLVKANDPLGLSYKMQEFFELWNSGLASGHFFLKNGLIHFFDFLHAHSLFLSILMITLEVVTGIALLIGWRKKLILNLLLVLIIFFTFLTGYAYLSGRFTNCGCFGDCLPITPLTSFSKDVALTLMILILIAGRKYINPAFTPKTRAVILTAFLLITVGFQWYALNFLPPVDCLPFKKGNNIAIEMQPPANAIQDSFAIRFIYEKDGKQYSFSPENLPADFNTYKFIDRKQELIRKGNAEPPIKGFSLTGISGTDSTQAILAQPEALLLFMQNFPEHQEWISSFKYLADKAKSDNIPVYAITSNIPQAIDAFLHYGLGSIPLFSCDFTVIRTAARTDPTLYVLKKGTIVQKLSYRDLNKGELEIKPL